MKPELTPTLQKYFRQLNRKLRLPKETKKRICADLKSSAMAKLEVGMSDAEIIQELGQPNHVAAEFHEQMQELVLRKNPLRIAFLLLSALSAFVLIGKMVISFMITRVLNTQFSSIGIIGGEDGPTSIFLTTSMSNRGMTETIVWAVLLIIGIAGCLFLKRREK